MINWGGVLDALNPTLTCRRYSLVISFYAQGQVLEFWNFERAFKAYREALLHSGAMHVSLTDRFFHFPPAPHKLDTPGVKYCPQQLSIYSSGQLRTPIIDERGTLEGYKQE